MRLPDLFTPPSPGAFFSFCMSLPFLESSAERVSVIVKPGMLCAFDFDGTLAPIGKDSMQARIPGAIVRRLNLLAKHARVAIITERSVENVGPLLDFVADFVVGNHGVEGIPGWENFAESYRQICQGWALALGSALRAAEMGNSGIAIENKSYSLSVHYRMARDQAAAKRQLLELFASLAPEASLISGEYVFHLLPPDAGNKGAALGRLCEASGASSALYVGDDASDEDIFRLCRKDWLTVRIDKDPHSAAEFHLAHRLEMLQLLDVLIKKLSEAQPAKSSITPIAARLHGLRSV